MVAIKNIDWDRQPLGRVPDSILADKMGVTRENVIKARERRGIPPGNTDYFNTCFCGKKYLPKTRRSKYCSNNCSQSAQQARRTWDPEMVTIAVSLAEFKRLLAKKDEG